MSERLDLLFSGSIFCDLVFSHAPAPVPGTEVYAEHFAVSAGGTANRAVAAARMGARTAMLVQIGDDPLGGIVRDLLEAEPTLDTRFLQVRSHWQTPVTVALANEQDRSFVTYEERTESLVWDLDGPAVGAVHVGLRDYPDWARSLRERGTEVVAGVGWDDTECWPADDLAALEHVDVFIPNELEAQRYTRTDDALSAAKALAKHVPLVLVTRGQAGVIAVDSDSGEVVAVPTITVPALDPTGAGDVFTGTFMSTLSDEMPLVERLRLASLCASLSVRSLGGAASAPKPADVLRYLENHRPDGEWHHVIAWATSRNTEQE